MRSTSAKHVSRSAGGTAAIIIFLLLFGLIMALPLLYTILQSLKPLDELFIFPPRFFVRRPTLENFIQLKNITSDLWGTVLPVSVQQCFPDRVLYGYTGGFCFHGRLSLGKTQVSRSKGLF